jgi:hypothetical protein
MGFGHNRAGNISMPPDTVTAADSRSQRLRIADVLMLLAGAGVGLMLVNSALATTTLDWRLDREVAVMVVLLLAPGGIAWVLAPWLLLRRRLSWSAESGLWLAGALSGLAWCEVFLDAGLYLGSAGKLLGGIGAFFISPAVGLLALGAGLHALCRRPVNLSWSLWCAIAVGLTTGVGWLLFLAVLLPLRF